MKACEVKIARTWIVMAVEDLHKYHDRPKRCMACGGAVRVYPKPLNAEHQHAHTGCPLSLYNFSGQITPHPQAVN